jgi:hypothetical protein
LPAARDRRGKASLFRGGLFSAYGARKRRGGGGVLGIALSPPPCFLEVLILDGLKRKIAEVLILVGLKSFVMNAIQNRRDFLEVLILKGLRWFISPP